MVHPVKRNRRLHLHRGGGKICTVISGPLSKRARVCIGHPKAHTRAFHSCHVPGIRFELSRPPRTDSIEADFVWRRKLKAVQLIV